MGQKRAAIPDIKDALNRQVFDHFAWLKIETITQISLF